MTLLDQIAEKIAAIRFDALPPEAIRAAKMGVFDTVGVTLAGAGEPCTQIVLRTVATGGGMGAAGLFEVA